jgi:Leucine-rich repeat (LRR) protein
MLLKIFIIIALMALVAVPLAACQEQQEPEEPSEPQEPEEPEIVTFPDEGLECAIRDALGKAADEEITAAELAELTILRAELSDITDLSGLEYCTNLTVLLLFGDQISDLSPLANLTSLINLYLNNNQISDLSPLLENSGLGEGDVVTITDNNLDLSEGSEDMENIGALEDRGITVSY